MSNAESAPTYEPGVDPHEHDENPEDHIGDPIPDPWEDAGQEDWPNETVGED